MKSYCIMHLERHVATIRADGSCTVYFPQFMPYNLYLEKAEAGDYDTRVNNVTNFYAWCSSRVLTLDRKYAKEILNSLGLKQAVSDKERAEIAVSYHCLSLTDVYWVREKGETTTFSEISLYHHSLSDAFVDVALRGRSLTAQNAEMIARGDYASDVATAGVAPKAWVRRNGEFRLLKDGSADEVNHEILASKIAQCFDVEQVTYELTNFDGEPVSSCALITSEDTSIVAAEFVDIYAANHDTSLMEIVKKKDPYSFHVMNIIDYLVGNTDRHWGNWGFTVDNRTNKLGKLYPLMDFNRAFCAYETREGARSLTVPGKSQMEAAIEAVNAIGLPMKADVRGEWFPDEATCVMFRERLRVLEDCIGSKK